MVLFKKKSGTGTVCIVFLKAAKRGHEKDSSPEDRPGGSPKALGYRFGQAETQDVVGLPKTALKILNQVRGFEKPGLVGIFQTPSF